MDGNARTCLLYHRKLCTHSFFSQKPVVSYLSSDAVALLRQQAHKGKSRDVVVLVVTKGLLQLNTNLPVRFRP